MMTMYADDTQYRVTSNSRMHNQMYIESTFNRMVDFLNSNGLEVNQSKTTLTEFMSHQKRAKLRGIPPELTVRELVNDRWEDKLIIDSNICRTLGLNLQNNLSWGGHLIGGKKPLLPAIRRQIGMLTRLRDSLSRKARLRLIDSLVISRLVYGITLWGNTTNNYLVKAQVCLNMAARFVTGDRKTTRKEDLMTNCDWLDIWELTEYHSLTQIWKATRWNSPHHLSEMIRTEENGLLTTREPRLQLTRELFRHKSIRNWNNLPMELRTENKLGTFKRTLRCWLKDRRRHNDDLAPD